MKHEQELFFGRTNREKNIDAAAGTIFDLVVVGGNLLGANVALEASAAGANVLLLANEDYGSFDQTVEAAGIIAWPFGKKQSMAVEKLRSRAPHLFVPSKIIVPTVKVWPEKIKHKKGSIFKSVGKKISQAELKELSPALQTDYYKGAAIRDVFKLDKSRFIIDTVKTAKKYGATTFNYIEPRSFEKTSGKVDRLICYDKISKAERVFSAKQFVYLPEVPVSNLNEIEGHPIRSKCIFQGFVSRSKLNFDYPHGFSLPEGNQAYVVPRKDAVGIYFTNPEFSDFDCSFLKPTLLKAFNIVFPHAPLKASDVFVTHFAYRQAIGYNEKSKVVDLGNNLILATAPRSTDVLDIADKIFTKLKKKIPLTTLPESLTLDCSAFDFEVKNFNQIIEFADEKYDEAKSTGIPSNAFQNLFYRYGKNIDWITNQAYELHGQQNGWEQNWLASEVSYAARFEGATSLNDFFERRTAEAFFEPQFMKNRVEVVARNMAEALHWSESETKGQLQHLAEKYTF